jgi:O-antigen/teichoic acid export membrane protein
VFLFAYLGRYEFGVFAIVSAIINFLVYFSDIGLAAALIQKKERPTETDLRTTFLVQQILVLAIIIGVFAFSVYRSKIFTRQKRSIPFICTFVFASFIVI